MQNQHTEQELLNEVPSLDLADFTSGDAEKKAAFVKNIGSAFNNIGFVAIKNHGLSDAHISQLYALTKAFFERDQVHIF